MSMVCLCVCLSVREDISGTRRAIFTNFAVHVAYGRGSVLRQDDEINEGVTLWGCLGKSIDNRHCRVRCKRDRSFANNVMQQKGSFSMPVKRKQESGKL